MCLSWRPTPPHHHITTPPHHHITTPPHHTTYHHTTPRFGASPGTHANPLLAARRRTRCRARRRADRRQDPPGELLREIRRRAPRPRSEFRREERKLLSFLSSNKMKLRRNFREIQNLEGSENPGSERHRAPESPEILKIASNGTISMESPPEPR